MSGVAVQLRRRRLDYRRPMPPHITKAEHAETFRIMAASLHAYADDPDAAASALTALDHAERLEQHPRCGWYPAKPRRR